MIPSAAGTWANSLFEDNAEFGLGIHLANKVKTNKMLETANTLINSKLNNDNLKAYLKIVTLFLLIKTLHHSF